MRKKQGVNFVNIIAAIVLIIGLLNPGLVLAAGSSDEPAETKENAEILSTEEKESEKNPPSGDKKPAKNNATENEGSEEAVEQDTDTSSKDAEFKKDASFKPKESGEEAPSKTLELEEQSVEEPDKGEPGEPGEPGIQQITYKQILTKTDRENLVKMTPLTWSANHSRINSFIEQDSAEITLDLDILIGINN